MVGFTAESVFELGWTLDVRQECTTPSEKGIRFMHTFLDDVSLFYARFTAMGTISFNLSLGAFSVLFRLFT